MISLIIMTAYILPLVQSFANSIIEATGDFKFKAKVYFITITLGVIIGGYLSKYYGYWAIAWSYSIFWLIAQIIMKWWKRWLSLKAVHKNSHSSKGSSK